MITIENLNLNKFVKTDEFIFILGDIRSNLIIANNIITGKNLPFFKKIKFLYNIWKILKEDCAVHIQEGLNKRYSLRKKKIVYKEKELLKVEIEEGY
jgi:hypothetical protein